MSLRTNHKGTNKTFLKCVKSVPELLDTLDLPTCCFILFVIPSHLTISNPILKSFQQVTAEMKITKLKDTWKIPRIDNKSKTKSKMCEFRSADMWHIVELKKFHEWLSQWFSYRCINTKESAKYIFLYIYLDYVCINIYNMNIYRHKAPYKNRQNILPSN